MKKLILAALIFISAVLITATCPAGTGEQKSINISNDTVDYWLVKVSIGKPVGEEYIETLREISVALKSNTTTDLGTGTLSRVYVYKGSSSVASATFTLSKDTGGLAGVFKLTISNDIVPGTAKIELKDPNGNTISAG